MSLRSTTASAVASVGGMTLLSRLLGFARDMVIARLFGAGAAADAFFVAFKIPNLLRRLFAEGAFSQAFVPVLSEYRAAGDPVETRRLVDRTTGWLGGALFATTLVGVLAAPALILLFAPGFSDDPQRFGLASAMLRITFPYLFFISLTALAGAILNAWGRFSVPAFTPALLNLTLIAAAIWLAPLLQRPILALAWGVLIGGVVQLLFQLPFLWRIGLLPRPRWRRRAAPTVGDGRTAACGDDGVRRVLRLMGPALFGVSVAQINLLLDTVIASFLVAGSVSWLYYADRLMEFPLGVFGIALATVILPGLARRHAQRDPAAFEATLDWALRMTVLIALPAAAGLATLAGPALIALFQYGAFDLHDAAMTRLSLVAYAVGLPGFIFVKVLANGYYARQEMRAPVRIGVIAMAANMALNLAFVLPMLHFGVAGPHAGLALATSLAAFLNAALLYRGLRRRGLCRPAPGWGPFLLRAALATATMTLLLWQLQPEAATWAAWSGGRRVGLLALLIAVGVGGYFATLRATGGRPLATLRGAPSIR